MIINTIKELRRLKTQWMGQTIGLVPTMGALHQGHLSLVEMAKKECDQVVVSIFVNPSQFAPNEDLDKYPRTLDADVKLLGPLAPVVFAPSASDMYPNGPMMAVNDPPFGTMVQVNGISKLLEGSIRPNFFRGVCTVVSKLYNAIQPTHAYFGQKDAQQCVILNQMTKDLLYPIQMRIGETMRLSNGLAMSSRNVYLSLEEKERASILYHALMKGKALVDQNPVIHPQQVLNVAKEHILTEPKVTCQYLNLSHPTQLMNVEHFNQGAIFSGAILVGKTRIIDNILIGKTVHTWFD